MNFSKEQAFIVDALVLLASLLALGLIGVYYIDYNYKEHSLLSMAWAIWNGNDGDWGHCLIVPFISVGILVWERKKILSCELKPIQSAVVIMLAGFFFYWLGFRAEIQYFGHIGIQVIILGWILWKGGVPLLQRVFFPWVFLMFMWPFVFLDNMLAFPLRIIMTELANFILNVIGIDVVRQGTAILSAPDPTSGSKMGDLFAVDIANPCSGIRSLFALMMISALYAYFIMPSEKFFKRDDGQMTFSSLGESVYGLFTMILNNWKRWVIFIISLPLAVAGNLVRILILTFGTMLFGSEFAIGTLEEPSTFHLFAGFMVFVIALGGMAGVGGLLNLNWSQFFVKLAKPPHDIKKGSEY
ncbi:MAG: exosortase/archaeosortase family protein [Verrucomicrobiota bacterium]